MTDEQFKQLMDKLEEIRRAQQPYPGTTFIPVPQPMPPLTLQPQYYDGFPQHWRHTITD